MGWAEKAMAGCPFNRLRAADRMPLCKRFCDCFYAFFPCVHFHTASGDGQVQNVIPVATFVCFHNKVGGSTSSNQPSNGK